MIEVEFVAFVHLAQQSPKYENGAQNLRSPSINGANTAVQANGRPGTRLEN